MSDALVYTRGSVIPRPLGDRNYLNIYFAMYKRVTRSWVHLDLASPTYLGLGII